METKSFVYDNNTISKYKRNAYLLLIPMIFMAFLIVSIILFQAKDLNLLNIFTFSSLCIGFLVCFFLLVYKKVSLYKVEILVCLLAGSVSLLRTYDSILIDLGRDGDMHLGTFSYWMPLIYLLFFLTFRGKTALFFSISNFVLSFLPGIYHIYYSDLVSSTTIGTLIQFYLSVIGVIICLFFMQRMLEYFIQAEIINKESTTDYLTNIYNRRKMDMLLFEMLKKATDGGTSISAILFDVDYFKKINDTYGHDIGDMVLQELSSLIRNSLPHNANFGRWGGEEFLIITSNPTPQYGYDLAERIRMAIKNHHFKEVNQLTCSFGVANSTRICLPHDLIKRADDAMYEAKQKGRNQVQYREIINTNQA
jgi:diguanylate cyclase (GGDEF)-like protein